MQPQITLERDRGGGRLLQNVQWNSYQRWTAFRDKDWSELSASAIGHIKRATVCIENTRGPLDDEPVQLIRPNSIAKSFSKPVEEIENKSFFDLNFLMRTFQSSNPPDLRIGS